MPSACARRLEWRCAAGQVPRVRVKRYLVLGQLVILGGWQAGQGRVQQALDWQQLLLLPLLLR